jgi:hypothetical protein
MLVLFWYAAWGLLEEMTRTLELRYGYTKLQIYGGLFALVLAFIVVSPKFLIRV